MSKEISKFFIEVEKKKYPLSFQKSALKRTNFKNL
tara:strand:+ start:219 stop:323 length:105 start_codon:yes stop_codon:yes gene_type:complete